MTVAQTRKVDCWERMAEIALNDEDAFTELYQHFFPRVHKNIYRRSITSQ